MNQQISEKEKSGKFRKFSFMSENHPQIVEKIFDWAKQNNCYGLPYDELSYLYISTDERIVPKDSKGYKLFKGFSKGYSKNGKFKSLSDKFLISDLEQFKSLLKEEDFQKQEKCGYITQKLMENYLLLDELKKKYPNLQDRRIMVHLYLNDIDKIPVCEICGLPSRGRLTNKGFRKTCSEICRRRKEQSYKSYIINHKGESIRVQGYERFVIPEFLQNYDREDLKIGFEENGPIDYFYKNSIRQYYPDLFIVSENLIVEVKSDYSFKLDYEKNMAKRESCLKKGFKFQFHIWSEKEKKSKII